MVWTIEYSDTALKALKKLDRTIARRIVDTLETRIATLDDPRSQGKPLKGNLGIFWRYRIGDYRVLCDIQDQKLAVLVVTIGNRKDVY